MERQLQSETHVDAPADVVREVLVTEPARVLASRPVAARTRSFPVEVRVDSSGGTSAGQQVVLDLGLPDGDDEFPVRWVPASHTRVLPGFRGSLAVVPEGDGSIVRITGVYRPPLGRLGAFGDGLIGHRIARRSLDELVALLSTRLLEEARRLATTVAVRPASYPETFLG